MTKQLITMIEEDEAFNDIERQARQRKESVRAAINKEKPMVNTPAFPCDLSMYDKEVADAMQGMTLRDYFAAKAMQALIDNDGLFSEIPTQAYDIADAMLKAREA